MVWIHIRRMSVLIWVQIGSQRLSADAKKSLLARKDSIFLRIKLLRANKIKIVLDQFFLYYFFSKVFINNLDGLIQTIERIIQFEKCSTRFKQNLLKIC